MEKQTAMFRHLGRMEYKAAWDYQEQLLQENLRLKAERFRLQEESSALPVHGEAATAATSAVSRPTLAEPLPGTRHYLLFVEHPPVFTLGKSGKMEHVLVSEEELAARGIGFYPTNRGGDITFHGPGQIVGYPILDLERMYTDIGRYLRELEEVIILTLDEWGVKGERSPGETGVWIDTAVPDRARKICAMGVRCSRWVTMHGFALNVNTDLSYFEAIIPCGIRNKKVTSLQAEVGSPVAIPDVEESLKRNFEKVFGLQLVNG
ncbi:MAG TPA: lipoyl(octanoyl) transferase LipB [Chitinophagaceae bacterium]|jgi:lipoyl(octanoyl) transferase|nr:lipoyl(octanoyl) transferase LipB [Chitinophagaceae bacterium]